jgi:hypothetical protein
MRDNEKGQISKSRQWDGKPESENVGFRAWWCGRTPPTISSWLWSEITQRAQHDRQEEGMDRNLLPKKDLTKVRFKFDNG